MVHELDRSVEPFKSKGSSENSPNPSSLPREVEWSSNNIYIDHR